MAGLLAKSNIQLASHTWFQLNLYDYRHKLHISTSIRIVVPEVIVNWINLFDSYCYNIIV